jgi:hypothetical protein
MIGQVVLLGQINPVRPIADLVHSKGAKLLVDGVLGLGHVPTITISNNLVADGNGNLLPLPATPPGAVVSFLIGGFPCIFDLSPGTYTVNSDGTGTMNLATRLDPAITLNQFAGCQIAAKVTVPLVFKFSVSNGGTHCR